MRLALAVVVTLVLTAPASAGPGGKLAGSFTAHWQTEAWTGEVTMTLDPGDSARDAAVSRIRSVRHVLSGDPFSTEGAHVAALTSAKDISSDCGEGDGSTSRRTTTYGELGDADTPFFVDRPELDLLKGTGVTHAMPVEDNYGDPLPISGSDFFPVPGAVAAHTHVQPCPSEGDFATDSDDTTAIFGTDSDVAVPFGVPIFMESFEIPLRRGGSTWAARGTHHEQVLGFLPLDFTYDVKLLGPLASWSAICHVPDVNAMRRTRSASQAVALVKKAGWPKAKYAGAKREDGYPRGHYIVDPSFTSSGLAQCLVGRPKVVRVR